MGTKTKVQFWYLFSGPFFDGRNTLYGFGIGYGIGPKVLANLGLCFGIGPKEIEMIHRLFLVNCYLLHVLLNYAQPASNVGGLVIH